MLPINSDIKINTPEISNPQPLKRLARGFRTTRKRVKGLWSVRGRKRNLFSKSLNRLMDLTEPQSFAKNDFSNFLHSISEDSALPFEKVFASLQRFMIYMREISRNMLLEERDSYLTEMKAAADDLRSSAAFTLVSGIIGGAFDIGAGLVGLRGAIKAASIDASTEGEVAQLEKALVGSEERGNFTENMTEIGKPSQRTETSETTSKAVARSSIEQKPEETIQEDDASSINQEEITAETESINEAESKETSPKKLSKEQKYRIEELRNRIAMQANRMSIKAQVKSQLIGGAGKVIKGSLDTVAEYEKAAKMEKEASASTYHSYSEQDVQYYSGAGEAMASLRQRLGSIIDSEADTRRNIVRG